jgi:hypothetical protein
VCDHVNQHTDWSRLDWHVPSGTNLNYVSSVSIGQQTDNNTKTQHDILLPTDPYLIVKLHILAVDPKHLQPPSLIRHANVDLTVKAAKAAQCSINGIGPAVQQTKSKTAGKIQQAATMASSVAPTPLPGVKQPHTTST